MRIVHGMESLGGNNGAQSYMLTVADQQQRNGHEVWIYSEIAGEGSDQAIARGLRVAIGVSDLAEAFDVFFAHDTVVSLELLDARPAVPQLFVWHGNLFDVNVQPQLDGAIKRVVTLSSSASRRFDGLAIRPPLVELRQPINVTEFQSQGAIRKQDPRVLALSNYLTGKQLAIAREACKQAGLEFRLIGQHGEGPTLRPQDAINDADIVLGKGRVVLEAMACGRAVYVYDIFGGDGWVTNESHERLDSSNFSGATTKKEVGPQELAADLRQYDPDMGGVCRQLAISEHNVTKHVSDLNATCEALIAEGGAQINHDDRFELARLARIAWRHEADAFALNSRLERRELELGDARWALEKAEAELASTKILLDSAQGMADSRRVQLINRLIRPLDRLRERV